MNFKCYRCGVIADLLYFRVKLKLRNVLCTVSECPKCGNGDYELMAPSKEPSTFITTFKRREAMVKEVSEKRKLAEDKRKIARRMLSRNTPASTDEIKEHLNKKFKSAISSSVLAEIREELGIVGGANGAGKKKKTRKKRKKRGTGKPPTRKQVESDLIVLQGHYQQANGKLKSLVHSLREQMNADGISVMTISANSPTVNAIITQEVEMSVGDS